MPCVSHAGSPVSRDLSPARGEIRSRERGPGPGGGGSGPLHYALVFPPPLIWCLVE